MGKFIEWLFIDMGSPRGQGEAELRAASIRLGVGADGYLDQSELALVCRAVGMEKIADEVRFFFCIERCWFRLEFITKNTCEQMMEAVLQR